MNKKYEELTELVIEWAKERSIFAKSNPISQLEKTQEELDETMVALKRLKAAQENPSLDFVDEEEEISLSLFEAKDGIGDMLVTIIILAEMVGFDTTECLEAAYNEIKNRKGKMVNGFFVKES